MGKAFFPFCFSVSPTTPHTRFASSLSLPFSLSLSLFFLWHNKPTKNRKIGEDAANKLAEAGQKLMGGKDYVDSRKQNPALTVGNTRTVPTSTIGSVKEARDGVKGIKGRTTANYSFRDSNED